MVLLVTCLVCLYREIYIELYNNKKFFFLIILFFLFITLLSSRGSLISFFLGWDGLGVSSICLIIFYPNKNTLFNSLLTMIFNRLGDVLLILVICKFLILPSTFMFINSNFDYIILIFLILCGFTKRAQFPLSSWLPAAISAPTPISAIVHSSTLVTAGILLVQFFRVYIFDQRLNYFLLFFCSLTFLLGGLLGSLELDFKKIIAFSTISQIRMILFFCSLNLVNIALAHILFHAFFKTLLFARSGLFFLFYFSKQLKNYMNSNNFSSIISNILLFVRVYRIRGLIFSSSFFSKDIVLEILCGSRNLYLFSLLIMGRVITILYSSKLIRGALRIFSFNFVKNLKSFNFFFIFTFILFVVYSGQLFLFLIKIENFPHIILIDFIVLNVALISGLFFYVNPNLSGSINNFIFNIASEIYFIKYYTFSLLNTPFGLKNLSTALFHDSLFFKPFIFINFYTNFTISLFKCNFYLVLLSILVLIFAF